MKKKVLPMFLALLVSASASARSSVELKPFFDVNYSGLYGTEKGEKTTGKSGFGGGLSLLCGRKFYVEPGVSYISHRKEYTLYRKDEGDKFDLYDKLEEKKTSREQLLRIPVHLGVHALGNRNTHCSLRLFVGPTYGFLMKTNGRKADFNTSRWGFDAGLGVNIYYFFADFVYEHDFTKYAKCYTDKHNFGLQANVGVRLMFR